MKKFLSVLLVIVMTLSVFSITASAGIYDYATDVVVDDIYYYINEESASIVGFYLAGTDPQPGITIPETITCEGTEYPVVGVMDSAFGSCAYTSITLPSTIEYIADYAFENSPYLEEVVIPDECYFTYFGENAFLGTPYEAELFSQDEITFGENALYAYTGNADKYVIPDNIDLISPRAFYMSGVKSVVFNDNIVEIPNCAFASCRNLKEITIPDNIEVIGDGAFKDCTSLEKVTLGENVFYLGVDCFANTKLKTIHLGPNVSCITGAFKGCSTLENITIDKSNALLVTDGKAVYLETTFYLGEEEETGYILQYYLPKKAQGKITLNNNVDAIGAYAFYGCKNLEEVVAKDIEYVDSYAFTGSGIKKFSADSFYSIYDGAFRNCKNLKTINLECVDFISDSAFENCTSLENVTFYEGIWYIGALSFANTGLKEVVVYGDECEIGESAFKGCKNLESVSLEEGVYSVGMNAFLDCPKLNTIYISKTVKYIEDNAFNGCENVTFELIKGTKAYRYIKYKTDFSFEVVGEYTFFQRIIDFFRSIFEW